MEGDRGKARRGLAEENGGNDIIVIRAEGPEPGGWVVCSPSTLLCSILVTLGRSCWSLTLGKPPGLSVLWSANIMAMRSCTAWHKLVLDSDDFLALALVGPEQTE